MKDLIENVKRHLLSYGITAIVSGSLTAIGFFYSTNFAIAKHGDQIQEVKNDMGVLKDNMKHLEEKLTEVATKPLIIESQIADMKKQQDKMAQRIDNIYELLLIQKKSAHF